MESVHRAGRVWCLLMVAVLIAVPLIDSQTVTTTLFIFYLSSISSANGSA